ncbi:snaclec 3-like [Acanthaster planci]|uniref:Snaclec 3-like n=1 Tax=Acanthaster planci TaxID=133434 RepID=A0A8B7Z0U3_ACAPL|nr:snaclec 3-like [Acanthaster planci]
MHSTQHSLLVGLLVLGTGLEIVAQSTATVTCALDGFTAVVGSCYLDGDPGNSSWEEAKKYCLRKGAHLPYVNSGEESRYLVDMASSTNDPIWLGLRVTEDSEKSALQWGDGSPVDADLWIQFNPDRTYACAALRKTDKKFELADCSDLNHRICESEPDTPQNRELTTPTEAKSSKAETTLDDTIPKMTTTETTETLNIGTSPQTAASDTATMPEATATNFVSIAQKPRR